MKLFVKLNERAFTSSHHLADRIYGTNDGDIMASLREIKRRYPGTKLDSFARYYAAKKAREEGKTLDAKSQIKSFSDKSSFFTNSAAMGNYWKRKHELFARAFEAYVQDKLHENNRENTYLVAGAENKHYVRNPYPEGEERKTLNKAFDKLFDSLREAKTLHKALMHYMEVYG